MLAELQSVTAGEEQGPRKSYSAAPERRCARVSRLMPYMGKEWGLAECRISNYAKNGKIILAREGRGVFSCPGGLQAACIMLTVYYAHSRSYPNSTSVPTVCRYAQEMQPPHRKTHITNVEPLDSNYDV